MRTKFERLDGGTASDKEAVAAWRQELAAPEQEQIFHLVHLTVKGGTEIFLVDANHDVIYRGVTYQRFPFQYSGVAVNSDGTIDNATIEFANATRDLMYEIENHDGLRKSTLEVKTVSARFADYRYIYIDSTNDRGIYDVGASYSDYDKALYAGEDHVYIGGTWFPLVEPDVYRAPNPEAPQADLAIEDFFVVASYSAGEKTVQLRLAPPLNFDTKLPRRRYVADTCYFKFKSAECGYVGPLTTCAKTLKGADGCEGRNNTLRFGGFPGVNRSRRVIL